MFFDNIYGLLRVLIVGPVAYVALVAMLRISGKRTLSKMNAFDLIVTIALGSTLASIILTESVALVEGILGLAILIGLQYIITWLSVRSGRISRFVKAEPDLLLHNGHFLDNQLRRSRVTRSEVEAAIREQGRGDVSDIAAVVLETDGSFSVIPSLPATRERPVGVEHVSS